MGLMNIFAGSNLSAVFVGSGERDVIALSKTYLVINGSCYWVLGLLFIYRFTLQGLGNGWGALQWQELWNWSCVQRQLFCW